MNEQVKTLTDGAVLAYAREAVSRVHGLALGLSCGHPDGSATGRMLEMLEEDKQSIEHALNLLGDVLADRESVGDLT